MVLASLSQVGQKSKFKRKERLLIFISTNPFISVFDKHQNYSFWPKQVSSSLVAKLLNRHSWICIRVTKIPASTQRKKHSIIILSCWPSLFSPALFMHLIGNTSFTWKHILNSPSYMRLIYEPCNSKQYSAQNHHANIWQEYFVTPNVHKP